MTISEIITDKYKLRIPPTVYYDLLADVIEAEGKQELILNKISAEVKAYEEARKEGCNAGLKEYEAELKEPVIKIGDRVRTLVDKDNLGTERFPVGTIGEVEEVDGNAIAVNADGAIWYYYADTLELANDVILVGDEVYRLDANYRGVVTAVWEAGGVVKTERLTQSGKLACDDASLLHRTGRRFPEIDEVLKQMQEGNK